MMSFVFVVGCILLSLVVIASCARLASDASDSVEAMKSVFAEAAQTSKGAADKGDGDKTVLVVKLNGVISEKDESSGWHVDPASSAAARAARRRGLSSSTSPVHQGSSSSAGV